ncbi:trypsin-like peptidase domain-containing protein [Candidatus Woesearchaeota archaeon]|nr:trypsin-like peptidase domain-containing protein [Candidatus Woesearchaeota archaeon]
MRINQHFLNISFLVIVAILIFQGYLLYDLKRDLSNEIDGVENSLLVLDGKVDSQKTELDDEIGNLRKESAAAIKSLGGNIDALLKESEKSKRAIEELSEGLEELENVQIQASKDFSSIIEDVINSVVVVKAGNSFGSGVFVSPQHLVTNYHVIESNEENIIIGTVDNKAFRADLIGYESDIDLAVLRVENGNFPFLEFEDMDNVKIGESVIAVGSPLGLSFSVTQGIVSSKQRTGPNRLNIYLQTDAPINPGNSGGPLINLNKKIIAINTWKIANVEGLGFSIRADVAKDVYEEILAKS